MLILRMYIYIISPKISAETTEILAQDTSKRHKKRTQRHSFSPNPPSDRGHPHLVLVPGLLGQKPFLPGTPRPGRFSPLFNPGLLGPLLWDRSAHFIFFSDLLFYSVYVLLNKFQDSRILFNDIIYLFRCFSAHFSKIQSSDIF